jgi:hypothetical protein
VMSKSACKILTRASSAANSGKRSLTTKWEWSSRTQPELNTGT